MHVCSISPLLLYVHAHAHTHTTQDKSVHTTQDTSVQHHTGYIHIHQTTIIMLGSQHPPLKERVFHSSSLRSPIVHVHVPMLHSDGRPQHYKAWNPVSLKLAYEAVTRSGYSVRRAAEEYQVPRSTLHDRVSGKV